MATVDVPLKRVRFGHTARKDGWWVMPLTTFLVFIGLALIVFVEPPTRWFAVIEPRTKDRRPTYLALVLGLGYVATLLLPPMREFFSFAVPTPRDALLAVAAGLVWIPLVREFWMRQLVHRFLGLG